VDLHSTIRVLLVTIALLLGTVAALTAGIVAGIGGSSVAVAVQRGAVTFVGTVSLTLAAMAALGAL